MTLTQIPIFMLAHGERFSLDDERFEFVGLEDGEALVSQEESVFRIPSGTLVGVER
jgi:hypothetical protein